MKYIILLLFLTVAVSYSKEEDKFGKHRYLSPEEIQELSYIKNKDTRLENIRVLQRLKYALINGDTNEARKNIYIMKLKDKKINSITERYEAILAFIEGNYQKSLDSLSGAELNMPSNYQDICWLKITNLIILKKNEQLTIELNDCKSYTAKFSNDNFNWMQILFSLSISDTKVFESSGFKERVRASQDLKELESLLKTAIYLNQESLVVGLISQLPQIAYQSKRLRELVALALYRAGEKNQAKKFLEDIDTANAENIKGNILLEEGNYELAYGHFKLALKKKRNSYNALERAISLAWYLGQYEEGEKLLKELPVYESEQLKKLTLEAAFLMQQGKNKEAILKLDSIESHFLYNSPLEFNLLMTYNTLETNNLRASKKYADRACKQWEGLHCYLLYQIDSWDNFALTIKRDEPTVTSALNNLSSFKSNIVIKGITEKIIIDQQDIEELDEVEIAGQLKKQSTNP